MAGVVQPHAPSYISSRSADVILSDIRPTKLNVEALHCINLLLDEFLYSILNTARHLGTDQLRAGLHKVLPTPLGKDALLEAEMELRAYWERTAGTPGSTSSQGKDDQGKFHLQWMFELLRLKCEAYSTLSDADEDAEAEPRLYEQMNSDGVTPPSATLVAPAALYLTAILESVCEHMISNVGRVVARDSSRATANVQDLFVALCEDSSVYGLFKSMRVYSQIETMSKMAKPRRSKSFSSDRNVDARTTSPFKEPEPPRKEQSPANVRPRISSESSSTVPSATGVSNGNSSARSSGEKAKAIKIFANNQRSGSPLNVGTTDLQNGHKKSDSINSNAGKLSTHTDYEKSPVSPTHSDDDLTQEFDNLMRSTSTMKVSLTPDRLRTMEVFSKEKDQQRQRQMQKLNAANGVKNGTADSSPSPTPPALDIHKRGAGRRPSLAHVDSIIEDDEETNSPKMPTQASRPRQNSAAPTYQNITPTILRNRSASVATPPVAKSASVARQYQPVEPFTPPKVLISQPAQTAERPLPKQFDEDPSRPPRTRKVARNRESLDLDDVMGTSDDEIEVLKSPPARIPKGVSSSARDLISFLDEGPPEMPEIVRSPSDTSASLHGPKKGRLQRMISKLTLSDKAKSDGESPARLQRKPATVGPQSPASFSPALSPSKSMTNLSPLANKPILPRPPPPPMPISTSTIEPLKPLDNNALASPRPRGQSLSRKAVPAWEQKNQELEPPVPKMVFAAKDEVEMQINHTPATAPQPSSDSNVPRNLVSEEESKQRASESSAKTSSTKVPSDNGMDAQDVVNKAVIKVAPAIEEPSATEPSYSSHRSEGTPIGSAPSELLIEHARDMRQLLAHATSADECRIIVDMFMAQSGLLAQSLSFDPNPSPSDAVTSKSPDSELETAVVELLLGSNNSPFQQSFPRPGPKIFTTSSP